MFNIEKVLISSILITGFYGDIYGMEQQNDESSSRSMSISIPPKKKRIYDPGPINPRDYFRRSIFSESERKGVPSNIALQQGPQQHTTNIDSSHLFKRSLFVQNSSESKSQSKIDTRYLFKRSLFAKDNQETPSEPAPKIDTSVFFRTRLFQQDNKDPKASESKT